jgi:hypothetical protein
MLVAERGLTTHLYAYACTRQFSPSDKLPNISHPRQLLNQTLDIDVYLLHGKDELHVYHRTVRFKLPGSFSPRAASRSASPVLKPMSRYLLLVLHTYIWRTSTGFAGVTLQCYVKV